MRFLPLLILSAAFTLLSHPARSAEVEFHNAQTDTININRILADEYATEDAGNVERIARLFIGKPYEAGTLEGEREAVRVNLEAFDCTTYVETVLALAYTAGQHRRTWRDFTENLERLRYRNGRAAGYASRLHYPSEWVIDNYSRGNLREITGEIAGARHNVKSLDFMSRNAKLYPALADSATLAAVKGAEAGLSNHRYPLLKAPQVEGQDAGAHSAQRRRSAVHHIEKRSRREPHGIYYHGGREGDAAPRLAEAGQGVHRQVAVSRVCGTEPERGDKDCPINALIMGGGCTRVHPYNLLGGNRFWLTETNIIT